MRGTHKILEGFLLQLTPSRSVSPLTTVALNDISCSNPIMHISIRGVVQKGLGEARKIGFPTLNISYALPRGELLEAGVYAVEVNAEDRVYRAAACVGADWGTGQLPKFEVYLFDADEGGAWYDKTIEVKMFKKIRDLVRFGSAEEAHAYIAKDVENIKNFFGG